MNPAFREGVIVMSTLLTRSVVVDETVLSELHDVNDAVDLLVRHLLYPLSSRSISAPGSSSISRVDSLRNHLHQNNPTPDTSGPNQYLATSLGRIIGVFLFRAR